MWVHFALLFLAGTALVDSTMWKPLNAYHYVVRSRAITGIKEGQQVSGILTKGYLTISVMSPDVLLMELVDAKYAPLHKEIPNWEMNIPDNELNYALMSMTKNPLKVKLRDGKIDEIFVHPGTVTYPVNYLKGILSQLQFSIDERTHQRLKENTNVFRTYKTQEQTVTGYCDTLYDIKPFTKMEINNLPTRTDKDDNYYNVWKYRDYKNCMQESNHRFAMMNKMGKNLNQDYVKRLSSTDMTVSTNKEYITIQSSVMRDVIQIRPKVDDMETISAFSMMNLTLVKIEKISKDISIPTNLLSTGNLTYVYDEEEIKTWDESYILNSESESMRSTQSATARTIDRNLDKDLMQLEDDNSESNSREHGYLVRKRELSDSVSYSELPSRTLESRLPPMSSMIKQAYLLIIDIVSEIMTPEELLKQHTLEKFTILTKVLRQLDEPSLATLEGKILIPQGTPKQDEKKLLTWKVFRDAVTQAGTMSAFKIIRTWIMIKRIRDLEAAYVIGRLPRVVRQPTRKYLDEFYKLLDRPEMKDQLILNSTAPFAFAELISYALKWDKNCIYPVAASGPKMHQQIKERTTDTYIPYLAKELQKAHEKKHDSRIITYIIALGNTGHQDILPVLKECLEKKQLTRFQRMITVGAMEKLCSENHELVVPILYRIYQNEMGYYEERVMAVNLLLKNNPSASLLQYMAKRTHNEINSQVNNAVITGIDSLTRLNGPEYQELVRNAREAKKLVNKKIRTNIRSSTNTINDYISEEKDFAALLSLSTIGSKTTFIPKSMDLHLETNTSKLSPPSFNMQYDLSKLRLISQALRIMFERMSHKMDQSLVDELVEKLNITSGNEEETAGSLVWSSIYSTWLMALDKQMTQNLFHKILQTQEKTKYNNEYSVHANMLTNWELTIGYVSEIGIPVNYHLNMPMLISLKNKLSTKSGSTSTEIQINNEMDLLLNVKRISRIGFMVPFNNEQHFAGLDTDTQLHLPAAINLQIDTSMKRITIEYKPLPGTHQTKIYQLRVIPYTGNTRYPNVKPIHTDKNTQPIIIGKVTKTERKYGKINITRETDSFRPRMTSYNTQNYRVYQLIVGAVVSKQLHYIKEEWKRNYNPEEDNSIRISFNYEDVYLVNNEQIRSEVVDKLLEEIRHKPRNKEDKPISMTKFDVQVKTPDNTQCKCTGNILEFNRSLLNELYAKCDVRSSQPSRNWKMCIETEVNRASSRCPNLDLLSDRKERIKASIRWGKSCENGKEMNIEATREQSDDAKTDIINSEVYRRSIKELAASNYGFVHSEKICKVIDYMDELKLSVKTDPKEIETIKQVALKWLSYTLTPNINIDFTNSSAKGGTSDMIRLSVNKKLDSETMNVTMTSSPLTVQTYMDTSTLPLANFLNNRINSLYGLHTKMRVCILNKNNVLTFDGTSYPIKFNRCPRVLLIKPKYIKLHSKVDILSKLDAMSGQNGIAILSRDMENNKRQLIITYDNEKYVLRPSANNDKLIVNDRELQFQDNIATMHKAKIRIMKTKPRGIRLYKITIQPAEVDIWYDFENILIVASQQQNGQLRGMCGSNNDEKHTDLVTPKGCIVRKPEYMDALYTINDDSCPKDDVMREKKKEVEKAECLVVEHNKLDLTTDREEERSVQQLEYDVDRSSMQCPKLRTDIKVVEPDKTCFSIRPIPTCTSDCVKEDTTQKTIDYHCLRTNPEVTELKKRVEMGANPNFSRKTVSMSIALEIPTKCSLKSSSK